MGRWSTDKINETPLRWGYREEIQWGEAMGNGWVEVLTEQPGEVPLSRGLRESGGAASGFWGMSRLCEGNVQRPCG